MKQEVANIEHQKNEAVDGFNKQSKLLFFPVSDPDIAICTSFSPLGSPPCCVLVVFFSIPFWGKIFFATPGGLSHPTCTDRTSWTPTPAFSIDKCERI